jgi:histidinol-phosphate aminotransferase
VTPAQVFLGNGSDEVLAHVFMALLKHEQPILFPGHHLQLLPGLLRAVRRLPHRPLADDFTINPADYCGQPNGGIIFPNPNAPTGRLLALDAIEQILKANPDSVVVVDEAYVDFGGDSAIRWWTVTTTCWLSTRYPSRARWPACASASRSATRP